MKSVFKPALASLIAIFALSFGALGQQTSG